MSTKIRAPMVNLESNLAPAASGHLNIGMLLFPEVDQLDFTGPFEVLSRVPDSTVHIIWKSRAPLADMKGLLLTPTMILTECPQLDLIVVPGGYGQQKLMVDDEVLSFLRNQSRHARYVSSVCTGALVLGAAGLLKGYRATTHWTALPLLELLGATPVNERVVTDRNRVTGAGVTSGLDVALTLAALLRGEQAAQEIQLYMEYSPLPPFNAGTPAQAPSAVHRAVKSRAEKITAERLETCKRIAQRPG